MKFSMKSVIKKSAFLLAMVMMIGYTAQATQAAAKKQVEVTPAVYAAISKYKQKDYTACVQELKQVVTKDPNNAIAQYYLAITYTQLGLQEDAKTAYDTVIKLGTDQKLVNYSTHALACINNQPECNTKGLDGGEQDEMTVFIRSGKFVHDDVKKEIQVKSLDKLKDKMNNDATPDAQNYKYLNDASSEMPTDAEIASAVKTLAKLGFNPYATTHQMNDYSYANPQMAQMNAILGNTNTGNSYNNYLPYMMAQGANQNPQINQQMMQAMMMNQMMPDFGFGTAGSL